MEDRLLVSAHTGEVLAELTDGDKIVRAKSIDHIKGKVKSEFNGRGFVKVDFREGLQLIKELNSYEKSMLFTLQYYVSYESGVIQFPNGKDMCFEDICGLTGFSREKTSATISSLIKKDIVYKGRNSHRVQYFLNPWVATRGVIPNPTLKEMFKNYKIRSKGGIMWKDL